MGYIISNWKRLSVLTSKTIPRLESFHLKIWGDQPSFLPRCCLCTCWTWEKWWIFLAGSKKNAEHVTCWFRIFGSCFGLEAYRRFIQCLGPWKCHTTTHQLHLSIRNELLRIRFFLDLQPLDFHFQSAQKPTQDAAFTRTTSRIAMTLREGQLQRIVVSGALILCCPASRCGFMIPESAAVGIFGAWSCPFEWI